MPNKAIHNGKVFYIVFAILSFAIFVLTGIANYGYHQADELYQIIEVAGIKSGTFTPYVAWEYESQIRPMLQPTICLAFLKLFQYLSISDPFTQALILRLFTILLSFTAISLFVKNTLRQFSSSKRQMSYFAISMLLWFVPYVACRFSSESYGGIFFIFSLALYFSENDNALRRVILGLCLALSFVFRFQMALAIFGFLLWTIIVDKKRWKYYILPFVSFAVAYLILGIGVDSWYYGKFVFSPYNYLVTNMDVSADMFGSEPWWFYLYNILSVPTYIIGIPLAISIIYLIFRNPKNPFLWCLIPYLVVHSIIPHKEFRFMFPMVFLVPVLLMSACENIENHISFSKIKRIVCCCVALAMLIANSVGLAVVMTKSAGQQKMFLTKYIHDNCKDEKVNVIYGWYSNPYGAFGGESGFYRNDNATVHIYDNIYDVKFLLDKEATNFLTCRKQDLDNMVCVGDFESADPFQVLNDLGFEFISQSVPKFTERICDFCTAYNSEDVLYVFKYYGNNFAPDVSDYPNAKFFFDDCENSSWNQGNTLTEELAYSGNHSSLVCGEKPYSLTLEHSVSDVAFAKKMSAFMRVYQSDTLAKPCISFEMLRSEDDKISTASWYDDKTIGEWINISADFDLPEDFHTYNAFKVYVYNPSQTKIYCDDIFVVFY